MFLYLFRFWKNDRSDPRCLRYGVGGHWLGRWQPRPRSLPQKGQRWCSLLIWLYSHI